MGFWGFGGVIRADLVASKAGSAMAAIATRTSIGAVGNSEMPIARNTTARIVSDTTMTVRLGHRSECIPIGTLSSMYFLCAGWNGVIFCHVFVGI